MAQKYLIVVGDSTTAGGEAIEGDPGWVIECLDGVSRPLVRVNNTVICGQCGPTKVVQGASLFFSNSALAAYDGCLLACGHQMVSTKQRLHSVEIREVTHSAPASTQWSAPQSERRAAVGAAGFDEAFVLRSRLTGEPLANRRYKVHRRGFVETGTTDSTGATHLVTSGIAEGLVIELQEEGP